MQIDKQELQKEWIEALRSGKYPQTKNTLKDKKGYCCLGVLCELLVAKEFIKRHEEDSYIFDDGEYPPRVMDTDLCVAVQNAVGIGNRTETTLMQKNDGITRGNNNPEVAPLTFPEIADYLENEVFHLKGDKVIETN